MWRLGVGVGGKAKIWGEAPRCFGPKDAARRCDSRGIRRALYLRVLDGLSAPLGLE